MTGHDGYSCPCVHCQRTRRGNEDAIAFAGAAFLLLVIIIAAVAIDVELGVLGR